MKKKSSSIKIIVRVSALILIIVGVCGIAFYKASDYAVSTLLKSLMMEELEKDLDEQTLVALTEEIGKDEKTTTTKKPGHQKTLEVSQEVLEEENIKKDNESPKVSHKISKKETKDVLEEKVEQVIKQIPSKDKRAMLTLITNNISGEDMKELISLAKDGISNEDITKAKQIAIRSFTPEDLEEVRAYYKKYAGIVLSTN